MLLLLGRLLGCVSVNVGKGLVFVDKDCVERGGMFVGIDVADAIGAVSRGKRRNCLCLCSEVEYARIVILFLLRFNPSCD